MAAYRMGMWDYVTTCVVVFISTIPGLIFIYRARKVKSTRDFLSSSKGLSPSPIALSLAATALSGGSLVGHPNEAYRHGIIILGLNFGISIGYLCQAYFYMPVYFNTDKVSIYEYLERRYSRNARLIVSAISSIDSMANIATVTYIPAIGLSQASGINVWYSVAIINGICILYTSFGGFKAVVWADVCQLSIIVAVTLAILIKGVIDQGGVKHIWNTNAAANRTILFRADIDNQMMGLTFWTTFFGGLYLSLSLSNSQAFVQRFWAAGNMTKARRSANYAYGLITIFNFVMTAVGFTMYSKFFDCDPLISGQVKTPDQEITLFVAEIFNYGQGVVGIYFAGLLCSSISTISSNLNGAVCFVMDDFLKPWSSTWSESKTLAVSKVLGLIYGCLSLSFVFLFKYMPGATTITFTCRGLFSGPILGIFTLGMLSPWTDTLPAVIGSLTSMAFIGWVSAGRFITKPIISAVLPSISGCNATGWTNLSSNTSALSHTISTLNNTMQKPVNSEIFFLYTYHPYWYPCWSTVMTVVVGLMATILLGAKDPERVDPKMLYPFVTRIINLLPTSIIKHLGFKEENVDILLEPKEISKIEVLENEGNKLGKQRSELNNRTTGENAVQELRV